MISVIIQDAQRAVADRAAALAQTADQEQRLAELKSERAALLEEVGRLEPAEEADAARRIIDGADAAPEKPKRVSRIKNIRERLPHLSAAITLQERRVDEARAAIGPKVLPVTSASLRLVAAVQGDALTKIQTALDAVAPSFACLLAADHILAGLVGTSGFAIPVDAPPPINGARLLEGLLKNIPPNLRPASLEVGALASAASAISQPIIAEVKGTVLHGQ
jgi:hypothetical protein